MTGDVHSCLVVDALVSHLITARSQPATAESQPATAGSQLLLSSRICCCRVPATIAESQPAVAE